MLQMHKDCLMRKREHKAFKNIPLPKPVCLSTFPGIYTRFGWRFCLLDCFPVEWLNCFIRTYFSFIKFLIRKVSQTKIKFQDKTIEPIPIKLNSTAAICSISGTDWNSLKINCWESSTTMTNYNISSPLEVLFWNVTHFRLFWYGLSASS